jgi:hypothetical protein
VYVTGIAVVLDAVRIVDESFDCGDDAFAFMLDTGEKVRVC